MYQTIETVYHIPIDLFLYLLAIIFLLYFSIVSLSLSPDFRSSLRNYNHFDYRNGSSYLISSGVPVAEEAHQLPK